jgi:bifunctional DNA-binding transcriptional regulator/antitoxin component of YhaV-PrlF toxin-antitoxin module
MWTTHKLKIDDNWQIQIPENLRGKLKINTYVKVYIDDSNEEDFEEMLVQLHNEGILMGLPD